MEQLCLTTRHFGSGIGSECRRSRLNGCLKAPTAYSGKTVEKQRDGRANLRPFVAGDPRINRRGRPKSFDQFKAIGAKRRARENHRRQWRSNDAR